MFLNDTRNGMFKYLTTLVDVFLMMINSQQPRIIFIYKYNFRRDLYLNHQSVLKDVCVWRILRVSIYLTINNWNMNKYIVLRFYVTQTNTIYCSNIKLILKI